MHLRGFESSTFDLGHDGSIEVEGEGQQAINAVVQKELRDKACQYIARWFYDARIPFHVANYDSFKIIIEAIGQFGLGMKPSSMYKLRVKNVEEQVNNHKKEWAEKGCSILSDEIRLTKEHH
ncbi:LOW QUALITY PROTEIN: hypothetical protein OSB04_007190 [Centaurea solstitialis]|uniref:Uncharacterized protein n=1 Tax=Centaurea solstitialis TaxID=347529 RepID=A0AA38TW37_9ASTR|nr:LOW QUALITY PROTEIN: hypothetical protein OSB04_007190 [Centaurea solstitialis]